MNSFEQYCKEIYHLLEYEEYQSFLKRLIDLTLDTEDVLFYRKTCDLMNWLDTNPKDRSKVLERLDSTYREIITFLSLKTPKKRVELLRVDGLQKKYNNSPFQLGPISFSISEGQITGLVGENGNGKTSLLRLLCGELEPTRGNIEYKFPYKNEYDLRTRLIYIPQRTKDWHGSLLSNLMFTASSYGIRGEENELLVELVIARMGLRKFRSYSWKNLSSGYKMRFELARMLLRKPKLLLIDEPLANLDILAQQVVLDDFRNIAKSLFRPLGIVLSSQQLYEVEKTSDRVIFLKNGKPNTENQISREGGQPEDTVKFIVEFESSWNHEQLREAFSVLDMEKMYLEGGNYIAIFTQNVAIENFLQVVIDHSIPLNYFRNISNSTRRFFLS